MPTKYKIAIGLLSLVAFAVLALLKLATPILHWALAELGLYLTLAGVGAWLSVLLGSVWLINKINRDWPTLSLPPEPVASTVDVICEAGTLAVWTNDARHGNARAVQHPVSKNSGSVAESP